MGSEKRTCWWEAIDARWGASKAGTAGCDREAGAVGGEREAGEHVASEMQGTVASEQEAGGGRREGAMGGLGYRVKVGLGLDQHGHK